MNDPRPITLRAEDRPAPPDAQQAGIDLMALLREIEEETVALQTLLTRWGNDPLTVMHKAQGRTVELRALAIRAPMLGEQLMQSLRSAGALSSPLSTREANHGR